MHGRRALRERGAGDPIHRVVAPRFASGAAKRDGARRHTALCVAPISYVSWPLNHQRAIIPQVEGSRRENARRVVESQRLMTKCIVKRVGVARTGVISAVRWGPVNGVRAL